MTTYSPRLNITELASTQNDRAVTVNEAIAKLEAGAGYFCVNSVGDTAPAGTPSNQDGDLYIVGVTATDTSADWTGHTNEIALFYNETWYFLPAIEGMLAYAQDEDIFYKYSGSAWAALNVAYDIPLSFADTPSADSQLIGKVMIVRDVAFAADFAGSYGHVGTNPSITYAIDVQDDGVSIGTISISTGGVFTFTTTSGTAKTVAAGSRLEFYAPSGSPLDWTIADIAATLYGTVAL